MYVGSFDYMDPYLMLPPVIWSGTLRYGFVGCLRDLFINGASIDVVQYAHQQDVGRYLCSATISAISNMLHAKEIVHALAHSHVLSH